MITLPTNRTFGIELEAFGVDRRELARHIRAAGIDVIDTHYSGSDYTRWQIKPDGSISGPNGFEIVSPVLSGQSGITQIKMVLEIANRLGGDVNRSCGFHIHWNVADWRIKHFRNFYKRWAKFERGIDSFMPQSRRGDNAMYCQSVYAQPLGRNNSNPTGWVVGSMFDAIDRCRSLQQLRTMTQGTGRYCKLNVAKFHRTGTIEIRHHSGTLDFEKVCRWIALTGAMIANADDGKAVKNFTDVSVAPKKVLDTLLGGLVRVGGIDAATRAFFKKRAKHFADAESDNTTGRNT